MLIQFLKKMAVKVWSPRLPMSVYIHVFEIDLYIRLNIGHIFALFIPLVCKVLSHLVVHLCICVVLSTLLTIVINEFRTEAADPFAPLSLEIHYYYSTKCFSKMGSTVKNSFDFDKREL